MSVPLCRRVKTNGIPCGSPALNGSRFCYYHRNLHHSHRRLLSSVAPPMHSEPDSARPALAQSPLQDSALDLPTLEDAESIQLSISLVVGALARNRLDPRRGAAILYGLQLASANVRRTDPQPYAPSLVRSVTRSRSGIDLVPLDNPDNPEGIPPSGTRPRHLPARRPGHTHNSGLNHAAEPQKEQPRMPEDFRATYPTPTSSQNLEPNSMETKSTDAQSSEPNTTVPEGTYPTSPTPTHAGSTTTFTTAPGAEAGSHPEASSSNSGSDTTSNQGQSAQTQTMQQTTHQDQQDDPSTTVGELRRRLGPHFAAGYGDRDTLGELLGRAGVNSLAAYLKRS